MRPTSHRGRIHSGLSGIRAQASRTSGTHQILLLHMPVSTYHDWPVRPETQANTPERSGRVRSSQDGGVHKLQVILAVSAGLVVKAIPWSKQILKVFVRDPAGHNGRGLKSLWVSCFEICQLPSGKKSPTQKGEAFYMMPGSCLQGVGRSRST